MIPVVIRTLSDKVYPLCSASPDDLAGLVDAIDEWGWLGTFGDVTGQFSIHRGTAVFEIVVNDEE